MTSSPILSDLIAEQDALDRVVAAIADQDWQLATPSPRWTITDQIGHLTFFDNTAALSMHDPAAFVEHRDNLLPSLTDDVSVDHATLGEFRALSPEAGLKAWRDGRARLADAAEALAPDARVEWYGPSMSQRSFLTARIMETWAHGQDIVDALDEAGRLPGAAPPDTARLRHIAQLGVLTRSWSYAVRGFQAPTTEVYVELTAPDGDAWTFGDADAVQRVQGPAVDFCRVVTQRRNVADTQLVAVGDDAQRWMNIAQAFAGAPTDPPPPRTT